MTPTRSPRTRTSLAHPRARVLAIVAVAALACVAPDASRGGPAESGPRVYIISPAHGEVVKSPFKVVFGLSGMGVAPASIKRENTGHHHLLIDTPMPNPSLAIPNDANHRHFGGGQTETVLDLPPGKHTLQLLMGDFIHVPHDPPVVSEVVTITVRE